MKNIAAYLLLQIGGNASPSAADVKKVLSAVGIDADDRLDTLISELKGKSLDEVRYAFCVYGNFANDYFLSRSSLRVLPSSLPFVY